VAEMFRGIPRSLKADTGIIPQTSRQQLPSISLLIDFHYHRTVRYYIASDFDSIVTYATITINETAGTIVV
jgi:hypothetical protein